MRVYSYQIMQRSLSSLPTIKASKQSGLQKQVISLYRKLLRVSLSHDAHTLTYPNMNMEKNGNDFIRAIQESSTSTFAIRTKFRTRAMSVGRRDIDRIEHLIRQGEKYVKILKMDGYMKIS